MENQPDKIVEWFNRFAKEYQKNPVIQSWCHNGGVPVEETIFDYWALYIQQYFKIEPKHILLDVGCGSGLFLGRFKQYTTHLYGVDPAEEVIKSSQLRYPDVVFRKGDVFTAGFEGVKFDRLFCNSVLFYLNNMDECSKALEHFFKITTPDAKIWLGDIPMPNPALNDKDYKRVERSTGWKVQHYPPQFFYQLCDRKEYSCRVFYQEVPGKLSSAYRYDLLIEKN